MSAERRASVYIEPEWHDRSGCFGLASLVLVGNHALRGQAEPVTVERQCPLDVLDGEGNDMHAKLHEKAPPRRDRWHTCSEPDLPHARSIYPFGCAGDPE